jgi:membrane dipeptidase
MHKSLGGITSFGDLYRFVDRHPDEVTVETSVAGIRRAASEGRIAFIIGSQEANGLEALLTKDPFGTRAPFVNALRAFYQLGLRCQGICYNLTNIFGGGCMDHTVPLTRVGRRLVEEIHGLGVILDVGGHTGEQTSLDAIAMSSGVPIVCTHTNMAALNPNPRAISDRLAERIAGTGGVIGITAISDFQVRNASNASAHGKQSPQATLDVHLNQYDHLKRLVGVDHIGLGPDFIWGWGDDFVHDAETSMAFPPEALSERPSTTQGFEDISKLPNLIEGLKGRGWTESELDQVLGANWLRVYEKVWGS